MHRIHWKAGKPGLENNQEPQPRLAQKLSGWDTACHPCDQNTVDMGPAVGTTTGH